MLCIAKERAVPLELREALEQINEIRGQLATAETFRGYRAASAAATGVVALLAALAQPAIVGDPAAHPLRYVVLWVGAAVLCSIGAGTQILYGYLQCASPHRRATTRIVVGHLIPPVTAGAVITWALMTRQPLIATNPFALATLTPPAPAALLPGLWAILVGLGVFASRRHLPRAIGWVGLYYLGAGAAILKYLPGPEALAPWVMGATFSVGQLAAALVLYWNLERNDSQKETL